MPDASDAPDGTITGTGGSLPLSSVSLSGHGHVNGCQHQPEVLGVLSRVRRVRSHQDGPPCAPATHLTLALELIYEIEGDVTLENALNVLLDHKDMEEAMKNRPN